MKLQNEINEPCRLFKAFFTAGCLLAVLFSAPVSSTATTYYLSPVGSDTGNGLSETSAWKSFSKAFSSLSGGDELVLLDGTYSEAAGTGYISYSGTNSAQIPSGASLFYMTYVHAKNPGKVTVTGRLFIGRSTRKDTYIKIQGITFENGGELYNTSHITIKDCGFHDTSNGSGNVFVIGTIDHNNGNTFNLIEDSWIWGRNRLIAVNYRADNNVWRRVVIRGDGCNSTSCAGSGNPNVGITIYNSSNVSFQNVIVLDRILDGGYQYADFATAQHNPGPISEGAGEYQGPNEWLGTISLNAPDSGYYFESDTVNDNTVTIKNAVAWGSADHGFNIGKVASNILVENITAGQTGNTNVRIAPEVTTGILRNIVAYNAGKWGINSAVQPSYSNVYGSIDTPYNQTTCATGCKTTNPMADGSLKYITRIETGSALKGTGFGGGDYGANVVYRYGTSGSRSGDPNYNTLSTSPLWPWLNETRIKTELCAFETRGFCSAGSLTSYIWGVLGNPLPTEFPPAPPTNLRVQ